MDDTCPGPHRQGQRPHISPLKHARPAESHHESAADRPRFSVRPTLWLTTTTANLATRQLRAPSAIMLQQIARTLWVLVQTRPQGYFEDDAYIMQVIRHCRALWSRSAEQTVKLIQGDADHGGTTVGTDEGLSGLQQAADDILTHKHSFIRD